MLLRTRYRYQKDSNKSPISVNMISVGGVVLTATVTFRDGRGFARVHHIGFHVQTRNVTYLSVPTYGNDSFGNR